MNTTLNPIENSTDNLIAHLRGRVRDPQRKRDAAMSPASAALLAPTPWSLMPGAIARAENALKLKLPPLLRRLYAEVGNGGWGPSSGLLPLWRDDDNPTPRWASPALTQVSRLEECPALLPLCL